MPITPKEMIRLLRKNGFYIKNQNGSHIKMFNPKTQKQTIVPLHTKELRKGLEHAILQQAGLEVKNEK